MSEQVEASAVSHQRQPPHAGGANRRRDHASPRSNRATPCHQQPAMARHPPQPAQQRDRRYPTAGRLRVSTRCKHGHPRPRVGPRLDHRRGRRRARPRQRKHPQQRSGQRPRPRPPATHHVLSPTRTPGHPPRCCHAPHQSALPVHGTAVAPCAPSFAQDSAAIDRPRSTNVAAEARQGWKGAFRFFSGLRPIMDHVEEQPEGVRVLVVDDEPSIVDVISMALRHTASGSSRPEAAGRRSTGAALAPPRDCARRDASRHGRLRGCAGVVGRAC